MISSLTYFEISFLLTWAFSPFPRKMTTYFGWWKRCKHQGFLQNLRAFNICPIFYGVPTGKGDWKEVLEEDFPENIAMLFPVSGVESTKITWWNQQGTVAPLRFKKGQPVGLANPRSINTDIEQDWNIQKLMINKKIRKSSGFPLRSFWNCAPRYGSKLSSPEMGSDSNSPVVQRLFSVVLSLPSVVFWTGQNKKKKCGNYHLVI